MEFENIDLSAVTSELLEKPVRKFPQTRYQGSKLKLNNWLEATFRNLNFNSVLDAFGGTGAVSYLLKDLNKTIHYNDLLGFNYIIGKALIENGKTKLSQNDLVKILTPDPSFSYKTIIQDNFRDIYYLNEENQWLDMVTQNIHRLNDEYKQALAFWALFQSCLIKRPYNLFHRKNLYVRTSNVRRTFGNKTTWDKPFVEHFLKFAIQANQTIFCNGKENKSFNKNAVEIEQVKNENTYDLVYIDTPYIPAKGPLTNYFEFYHFLEGLTHYDTWESRVDYKSKHRKLQSNYNPWCDKKNISKEFEKLFDNYRNSTLVVSYRQDGIPSIDELVAMLKKHEKKVSVRFEDYKYVLSTKKNIKETILIAE